MGGNMRTSDLEYVGGSRSSNVRFYLWVMFVLTARLLSIAQTSVAPGLPIGTRNAIESPGASIVERIQAAIRDVPAEALRSVHSCGNL